MDEHIETVRLTEGWAFDAYRLVSVCYICEKPVQYANRAEDLPRYPQICRKCKEAILWAREKMESEKND